MERAAVAAKSASKQTQGFSQATRSTSSAGNAFTKAFGKAVWNNATSGVRKLSGAFKILESSFARILKYRLIRGMIREISDALKQGVQNVYKWSKATKGDFAASVDSAKVSLDFFKNSVGAAVAPLMNVFAPAISAAVDVVVSLINALAQLIALLTGRGAWTRATKNAKNYGEAVSNAGGAAKEAMKYLAPFDELNRLPGTNDGGGGGGTDTDWGGGFEDVTTFSDDIADFAQSIRDAIANADWAGLGSILGDAINDVVDKIDFAGIGKKVGEKINALFTTEYWTLKTINFQNIGAKIAEFFNNALAEIDFTNVGGTIAQKLTILPSLFIGAINELDFSTVGKSIGDTVKGFFTNIGEWARGVNWSEFGASVANGIIDVLTNIDLGGMIDAGIEMLVDVGAGIAQAVASAFSGVGKAIKEYFASNSLWEDIKNTFISKWNTFAESLNQYLPEKFQLPTIPVEVEPEIVSDNVDSSVKKLKKAIEKASQDNPANVTTNANIKTYKNKLKTEPKIPTVAKMNTFSNGLTGRKRPFIPSIANINGSIVKGDANGRIGVKANADIQKVTTGGRKFEIDVTGKVTDINIPQRASGGVLSNGSWSSINRFAGGGLANGSQLFWARESGPELVGTLGNHTAVMNNDQIVASVSAGVARAIAGIRFQLSGMPSVNTYSQGEEIENALYRAVVRALSNSENGGIDVNVNLDGNTIYRSVVRRNRMNTAATGINALA